MKRLSLRLVRSFGLTFAAVVTMITMWLKRCLDLPRTSTSLPDSCPVQVFFFFFFLRISPVSSLSGIPRLQRRARPDSDAGRVPREPMARFADAHENSVPRT